MNGFGPAGARALLVFSSGCMWARVGDELDSVSELGIRSGESRYKYEKPTFSHKRDNSGPCSGHPKTSTLGLARNVGNFPTLLTSVKECCMLPIPNKSVGSVSAHQWYVNTC